MSVEELLATGELEIEGQLVDASNLALRVWLSSGAERVAAVYKPVRGERELWDFPDGTLAGRERATYLLAVAGGWPFVPETVLRDGPLGLGSVQRWVGPLEPEDPISLVRLDPVRELPGGFKAIIGLELEDEGPMALSHADDPRLASLAVLDVVLNNADRKGSHLIEADDQLWAIDHGVTCHEDPKLRTILWGWAGDPLPAADIERLHRLLGALQTPELLKELRTVLTDTEVEAVVRRAERLVERGTFPMPPAGRQPLPWPPW